MRADNPTLSLPPNPIDLYMLGGPSCGTMQGKHLRNACQTWIVILNCYSCQALCFLPLGTTSWDVRCIGSIRH
jgi:hypothetical protein